MYATSLEPVSANYYGPDMNLSFCTICELPPATVYFENMSIPVPTIINPSEITTDSFDSMSVSIPHNSPIESIPDSWTSGGGSGTIVSPPAVTATSTKNKATGVSRTKATTVRFNKNIFKSVNWSKVYIKNLKTGQKCKITKWTSGNHIYITTSKKAANTWYQVYIPASAVKDNTGYKLAKSYTWKFKTGK